MGVARLLAKGWIVFCLFAGAHGIDIALVRGGNPLAAAQFAGVCVFLFGAMGLLFVAGFGAASGAAPSWSRLKLRHLLPRFDGIMFLVFVAAVFALQAFFLWSIGASAPAQALQKAMYFLIPGVRQIVVRLNACGVDQNHIYYVQLASAVAWLLAIVYVASAASRISLNAGLVRLERVRQHSSFGPTLSAALYGIVAIIGIQLLLMGSVYPFIGCRAFGGIAGALLTGLAPLMLAYLIVAALVTLKASAPES
jgi:hypothetical protein